ncbi:MULTISPECIES: hypothetical protein [Flavobacteriaceae]|uniref:hypothetical protein n=1 Tax=Flavobacteriaceae TaxID=49546 RepID=UPI0014927A52|nr:MULTISPECIES: hypothetical protein [Allomuricauda]MDC6365309.1 hypothetical protein [Muricauda sp. AC10]
MGSASQPMLVVKANRALLKKRRSFKEIREAYDGYLNETQLQFKELTPFEQKKIRDKIIRQAKKDRLDEIKISLLALVVLVVLCFGIYSFFVN